MHPWACWNSFKGWTLYMLRYCNREYIKFFIHYQRVLPVRKIEVLCQRRKIQLLDEISHQSKIPQKWWRWYRRFNDINRISFDRALSSSFSLHAKEMILSCLVTIRCLEKVILTNQVLNSIFLAIILPLFVNFYWNIKLNNKIVIYHFERNFYLYNMRTSMAWMTATVKRKKTEKKCTFCRKITSKSVCMIKG